MRANLEYLVDQAVLQSGSDRRAYQIALVRQSQLAQGLALALPFSEPSLKSRISRMTGLAEYRLVAVVAAVALVFWLGIALLVVNGTVFSDELPVGREYLEAAAHPGDPYYDYYQNTLPEELTSLEIYTNRMVTVDEYLQLRAILSKVPGAKLFVYRNAFDPGYSLELHFGNHEPAVAGGLRVKPSRVAVQSLTLELNGGPGLFIPISITQKIEQIGPVGSFEGLTFNHRNGFSTDVLVLRSEEELLEEGIFGKEVLVYVNRERIKLVKQPDYKTSVNGTEVSDFGAEDWTRITVEGRSQPLPKQRLRAILNLPGTAIKPESFSYQSARQKEGTYRKWYESLRYLKDEPTLTYYNDHRVDLDFLLDTEFGDNAMIQHGVIYDTHMGRYALQVLDDYPDVTVFFGGPPNKWDNQRTQLTTSANEVNLYFRRLPTPQEVAQIRPYLAAFPNHGLRVFQDCKHSEGDYTLYYGDDFGSKITGFSQLAVGEVYDGPLRIQLKREASGEVTGTTHKPGPKPENAPNTEVFLMIDGVYVNIHSDNAAPYSKATLDPVPDLVALKCRLSVVGETSLMDVLRGNAPWMYKYKAVHPGMMEGFEALLEEKGVGDRPRLFFVNGAEVSQASFINHQPGEGAYVRMGTLPAKDNTPVILEIVD